jgi:hypothetical protein
MLGEISAGSKLGVFWPQSKKLVFMERSTIQKVAGGLGYLGSRGEFRLRHQ